MMENFLNRFIVYCITLTIAITALLGCNNKSQEKKRVYSEFENEFHKISSINNLERELLKLSIQKPDSIGYYLENVKEIAKKNNNFYTKILSSINYNTITDSSFYFSFLVFNYNLRESVFIEISKDRMQAHLKKIVFSSEIIGRYQDSTFNFKSFIHRDDSIALNSKMIDTIKDFLFLYDFWNLSPESQFENYPMPSNVGVLYITCIEKHDEYYKNIVLNHRVERSLNSYRRRTFLKDFIKILPADFAVELKDELGLNNENG